MSVFTDTVPTPVLALSPFIYIFLYLFFTTTTLPLFVTLSLPPSPFLPTALIPALHLFHTAKLFLLGEMSTAYVTYVHQL